MDKRVIARIAREHGPRLLQQAVRRLAADPVVQEEVLGTGAKPAKPSIGKRVVSAALLRVATRSVPGAILVGGGLITKALHDRHKARQSLTRFGANSGKLRG